MNTVHTIYQTGTADRTVPERAFNIKYLIWFTVAKRMIQYLSNGLFSLCAVALLGISILKS